MSLLLALALSTATSAATPPTPAKSSPQQDFDTASTAAAAGECEKAVPLFEALERRPGANTGSLPAGFIAVRKGACLIRMDRTNEGEQAILTGLPIIERAGPEFASDAAQGYMRLGDAALLRWDYVEARKRFEKALSFKVDGLRPLILVGLIRATTFDDGPEPLRYADEGIAFIGALKQPPKNTLAGFHTLKARMLLRRGQTEEAYAILKEALRLSGGLTPKTTLDQAAMRGDLALAALLLGKKDEARKYLAYTGAGRIAESPFATAANMAPPDCGEDTGLRAEDFAVVEFGIADDGSVRTAQTVYSRGGPAVAAAFARAVSEWNWRPESLAKLPLFYRVATRVELRCSAAGGPSPGIMQPLEQRFGWWGSSHLRLPATVDANSNPADVLRLALAEKERSADLAGQIAALGLLARTTHDVALYDRAIALRGKIAVPAETVNALRIFRTMTSFYLKARNGSGRRRSPEADLRALASDAEIAADALALATIQLLAENPEPAILKRIADDDRLPAQHSLRQVALLRLANSAAAGGDLALAQSFFTRTGLTEQQCALIGAKPGLRRTGVGSGDFPQEAMMYGFEGWVNLEFDITAEGRATDARALIAYPPFVFVDAATGMTSDIRYETSYRPSGGAACNANRETIRFILPFLRK